MAKIIVEITENGKIEIDHVGFGIKLTSSVHVEGRHVEGDAIANSVCKKLAEVYKCTLGEGITQAVKLTFDEINKAGEEK